MYWLLAILLGFLACLVIKMWFNAHKNQIVHHKLSFEGLPSSFQDYRIFFISDIHKRIIDSELLKEALTWKPDLIIIGGDLMDRGKLTEKVRINIQKMMAMQSSILFVRGNHDHQGDLKNLEQILRQAGVKIITNTSMTIERNGQLLDVIGLDDATTENERLEEALTVSHAPFKILLSHNPCISDTLRKEDGVSLVLSGHTHGGQIRIFGWGPREIGGVKQRFFGTLVISNGYGTTQLPLRLGADPDTLMITLDKN